MYMWTCQRYLYIEHRLSDKYRLPHKYLLSLTCFLRYMQYVEERETVHFSGLPDSRLMGTEPHSLRAAA